MAITAYVGYPRHGKSYSAVEQVILPALAAGRVVVTNLPLRVDVVLQEFPGADVRAFDLVGIEREPELITSVCPHGSVVVIDEAWRLWPAGATAKNIPTAFKSFLAEHGHRVDAAGNSQQIVLVTQDLNQVSAFARQLVEETFVCRKLTVVGQGGRFRTDVHQGHPTGLEPSERTRTRQIFGEYSERVWRFYTSHTMSQAVEGARVNEKAVDGRGNALRSPKVYAAVAAIVGLPVLGIWLLVHQGRALGLVHPAKAGGVAPLIHSSAGSVAPVVVSRPGGDWWVSVRLAGFCYAGRCGWGVVTDGRRSEWIALNTCLDMGMSFRCPVPSGGLADDSNHAPSPAPQGGVAGVVGGLFGH